MAPCAKLMAAAARLQAICKSYYYSDRRKELDDKHSQDQILQQSKQWEQKLHDVWLQTAQAQTVTVQARPTAASCPCAG